MASPKIVISVAVAGDRQLMVSDDHEVFIKDITMMKCAYFTAPRWARFVGMIEEIDSSVQRASYGKSTAYSKHIGATWYVSVDEKFPTVDDRCWYSHASKGNRLTPT